MDRLDLSKIVVVIIVAQAVSGEMLNREGPDTGLLVVALKGRVRDGSLEPLNVTLKATAGGGEAAAGERVLERDNSRHVQPLADRRLLRRDGVDGGGARNQDDDAIKQLVKVDVAEVDRNLEGDAADVLATNHEVVDLLALHPVHSADLLSGRRHPVRARLDGRTGLLLGPHGSRRLLLVDDGELVTLHLLHLGGSNSSRGRLGAVHTVAAGSQLGVADVVGLGGIVQNSLAIIRGGLDGAGVEAHALGQLASAVGVFDERVLLLVGRGKQIAAHLLIDDQLLMVTSIAEETHAGVGREGAGLKDAILHIKAAAQVAGGNALA